MYFVIHKWLYHPLCTWYAVKVHPTYLIICVIVALRTWILEETADTAALSRWWRYFSHLLNFFDFSPLCMRSCADMEVIDCAVYATGICGKITPPLYYRIKHMSHVAVHMWQRRCHRWHLFCHLWHLCCHMCTVVTWVTKQVHDKRLFSIFWQTDFELPAMCNGC